MGPLIGAGWVHASSAVACGQKIVGTAAALIAAYQAVFNDAFERYVAETMAALETAQREFATMSCSDLRLRIEQNHSACLQYPELLNRPDNDELLERAIVSSAEVIRLCEALTITHERSLQSLSEAVQRKRENVHAAVQSWDSSAVVAQRAALARAVEAYNQCIAPISAAIAHFKAGLDAAQVARRVQDAQRDLETLQLLKRRIESEVVCRGYSEATDRRRILEDEGSHLQEELDREQTLFLNRYFLAINRIFAALGSSRFAIYAESSRRGNMPTIQLRVCFNGVPIILDRLHSCFSESDRRALAFAVFWARIEMRDAADRLRTIVVLDDPVTSFDDGRIDRTIRLIELQKTYLRQIIVLSHYSAYIEKFFNRLHGQHDGLLLATLYQDATGTQMRRANPLDFIETDHQRAYRRIATFIERQHRDDVFLDLRIFLETEVRSRYYRAMTTNNLLGQQFAPLLDELTRLGAMSHDTREAIEPLRRTLNTDHHVWTNRSHEEKIGIATDLLRLAYEEL